MCVCKFTGTNLVPHIVYIVGTHKLHCWRIQVYTSAYKWRIQVITENHQAAMQCNAMQHCCIQVITENQQHAIKLKPEGGNMCFLSKVSTTCNRTASFIIESKNIEIKAETLNLLNRGED